MKYFDLQTFALGPNIKMCVPTVKINGQLSVEKGVLHKTYDDSNKFVCDVCGALNDGTSAGGYAHNIFEFLVNMVNKHQEELKEKKRRQRNHLT